VILAALILFARTVNWTVAWRAIRATSPGLLAAAAIVNLLSVVLKGFRWWIFLRPVGVPSLWLAIRATFAGAALNNILVANSGEAARVIFVARATHVPSEKVLATVALERLFEIVGYVVLLTLAVSFLALPPGLDDFRLPSMIALVVIVALLLYLIRHPEDAGLPAVAGEGLLHRVKQYGRGFLRTLTAISTPGRFGAALVLSVFVWAFQVATYHLTARAAHFDISVVGTIAALLAVNLAFLVRATPGNVGIFQMMYAVTAAGFGLDKDAATGVALLIQIQQVVPVLVLGLLAAPEMLIESRRDTTRRDNVLPGEPAPPKSTDGEG